MKTPAYPRPTILVLEALTGSSRCVRIAGGRAVTINPRNFDHVEELGGEWDALLLTGGGDVDPRRYGQKPHERVYGVNELRDSFEYAALDVAKDRGVPVLGICRGAQIMNIHGGGDLEQHIGRGHYGEHGVKAREKGSALRGAAGGAFEVVSYHHQRIDAVAPGWRVTGLADDGVTVEAIESADQRCLGVQFHPEHAPRARSSRAIFRWLVLEAAAWAGIEAPAMVPLPRKSRAKAKPAVPAKTALYYTGQGRSRRNREAANRQMLLGMAARELPKAEPSRVCPQCGIRFTNLKDRNDHIDILHRRLGKVAATRGA